MTVNSSQLTVLRKAKVLAKETYLFCRSYLPENEKYGLYSQMTRCSVSIASNIAEGSERGTKEFIHFLRVARGSLRELETQLEICREIGFCGLGETQPQDDLIEEVGRMTWSLIKSLEQKK